MLVIVLNYHLNHLVYIFKLNEIFINNYELKISF